jgi:hypothetical protein
MQKSNHWSVSCSPPALQPCERVQKHAALGCPSICGAPPWTVIHYRLKCPRPPFAQKQHAFTACSPPLLPSFSPTAAPAQPDVRARATLPASTTIAPPHPCRSTSRFSASAAPSSFYAAAHVCQCTMSLSTQRKAEKTLWHHCIAPARAWLPCPRNTSYHLHPHFDTVIMRGAGAHVLR